jgi:hypothetical protein
MNARRLPPPEEDEETFESLHADERNFYKVEKWTKDGSKVDSLLYAGNNFRRSTSSPMRSGTGHGSG